MTNILAADNERLRERLFDPTNEKIQFREIYSFNYHKIG
jgi:hypothetical protein